MSRDPAPFPASREPLSFVAVQRALADLRCGRAVVVRGGEGTALLAVAAEALTASSLTQLVARARTAAEIAVTARRATAAGLGEATANVVVVSRPGGLSAELALALADPLTPLPAAARADLVMTPAAPFAAATAAVLLAKFARLLPAAAIAQIADDTAHDLAAWANRHDLLLVDGGDVFQYSQVIARTLRQVGEARVPLAGAEDARLIAFRPVDGGIEHLAVLIGKPTPPALVRLHSECFTGDLLGSLRCDCGDQLRGAVREIAAAGGGVLLYLSQEGRGIGLVNKLRAYALQDRGFDTLDANEQLGFDGDERIYQPAAQMLRQLGMTRVRLLTNNPDKVEALRYFGIEVSERVPHRFPNNRHNEAYLLTKQRRSGHLM
jgi:GTP cyclohydrolase II